MSETKFRRKEWLTVERMGLSLGKHGNAPYSNSDLWSVVYISDNLQTIGPCEWSAGVLATFSRIQSVPPSAQRAAAKEVSSRQFGIQPAQRRFLFGLLRKLVPR